MEGMDGLEEEIAFVEAIRTTVKFVHASPARLDTFKKCVEIEKIKSRSLKSMDVETRWNSTYHMFESSIEFEKAFERYKLKYVEWNIRRLCDRDVGKSSYITSRVKHTLGKLYRHYECKSIANRSYFSMDNKGASGGGGETEPTPSGLDMYAILKLERSKAYENDMMVEDSHDNNSELEIYLLDKSDS
ncbi:hypothetical protein POM88_040911 [Heracleum sosnowskyi]|uniref:Uncharacterized protein n=1 Tax=Heracleum sosnowskyi TaxID=360622 RepID=A0AAD8HFQ1_9APIA|nr:hypothetical protein POM88_040911 [Heracleum sosnowskyi]